MRKNIGVLKPIADQLYEDYDDGDPEMIHFAAETGEFDAFLRIDLTVDDKGKLAIAEVCMYSEQPEQDPYAIPQPKTSGSILLNVGNIVNRIVRPGSTGGNR